VERFDDVGPRDRENLVAPFEGDAAKVVGLEVAKLQIRACGSVKDDDFLGESREIRVVSVWSRKRRTK
jgi:hypothetical protein